MDNFKINAYLATLLYSVLLVSPIQTELLAATQVSLLAVLRSLLFRLVILASREKFKKF
jgi:hypothetical protein